MVFRVVIHYMSMTLCVKCAFGRLILAGVILICFPEPTS